MRAESSGGEERGDYEKSVGAGAQVVSFTKAPSLAWGAVFMTVKQAAKQVGVCEETIRRAYWANQLEVQRFGARSLRIGVEALEDWMARGGKTTAEAGRVAGKRAA